MVHLENIKRLVLGIFLKSPFELNYPSALLKIDTKTDNTVLFTIISHNISLFIICQLFREYNEFCLSINTFRRTPLRI